MTDFYKLNLVPLLALSVTVSGYLEVQAQSSTETVNQASLVSARANEAARLFAKALALLKSNQAFAARELLTRASQLDPASAAIHCNLGLAYQNSGNLSCAISEFQKALELQPNMHEATLNMAGCYQSMGLTGQAIRWFEKYLSFSPPPGDAGQVRDVVSALKTVSSKPGADPNLPDYLTCITSEGTYRWAQQKMPLKIFIGSGLRTAGFRDSFPHLLKEAFDAWAAASGYRISYIVTDATAGADIICDWEANPAAVSRAGTQSERGISEIAANRADEIQRATIRILTRPMFQEGILSDSDLKKACLHEVGHVLGLQGHSTNNHDVMFFTIDTATVWTVLTRRDKETMAKLYASYSVCAPAGAESANPDKPK